MKRDTKPLGSAFPGSITLLGLALPLLMAVPESRSAEDPRKSAFASWTFDQSGPVEKKNPLLVIGDVEFLELPEEEKKASLARGGTGWFARLQGGHLDAGTHLNLPGAAGTVYLRARDPSGRWEGGLFSKRGSHEITNFNLFAADGRIGGEFHAEGPLPGSVSFAAAGTMGKGWHDLVVRYDGATLEIFCDGSSLGIVPWAGGKLTQNTEPLLIGAETVNGTPVRPFPGEIEQAAIWSRALKDSEIKALNRRP